MYLRNAWYVAAWDTDITDGLSARTILGDPIVFFRTEDGAVAALEDRCCHRGAPLSLGRMRGNELECGDNRRRRRSPHHPGPQPARPADRGRAAERCGVIFAVG